MPKEVLKSKKKLKKIVKKVSKKSIKRNVKKRILTSGENKQLFNFLCNHGTEMLICLRLTHHKVYFEDGLRGDDAKRLDNEVAAMIYVNPTYLVATINIAKNVKELWRIKRYEAILDILIHEICHIVVDPLYFSYENSIKEHTPKDSIQNFKEGDKQREQITEHVSRWGSRLYKDYRKENNVNLKTGKCIRTSRKKKS